LQALQAFLDKKKNKSKKDTNEVAKEVATSITEK
jgi:hypothetical protein